MMKEQFDPLAALRGEREPEMTPDQERLQHALNCIEKAQYGDLVELGFGEFFERLAQSYPPARGGSARRVAPAEMRAFFRLLHRWDANEWIAALELWQASVEGEHRPYPAQIKSILELIAGAHGRSTGQNLKPRERADETDSALVEVLVLLDAGELVCECESPPTDLMMTSTGVLRCAGRTGEAGCGRLELGQVTAALDTRDEVNQ